MPKIRLVDFIFGMAIILADIFVFIILGMLLMDYDDNYDSSKGAYWSFASMNAKEKTFYIIYNLWILLNIIVFIFVGLRIYKLFIHGKRKEDS
jgi:hypothetical protein